MMIVINSYEVASYVELLIFLYNNPVCQVDTILITFSQKMKLRFRKLKNLFQITDLVSENTNAEEARKLTRGSIIF